MNTDPSNLSIVILEMIPIKGKGQGLLEIANKLHITIPRGCKLGELRYLFSQHKAFQNVSILIFLLAHHQNYVFGFYKFYDWRSYVTNTKLK